MLYYFVEKNLHFYYTRESHASALPHVMSEIHLVKHLRSVSPSELG